MLNKKSSSARIGLENPHKNQFDAHSPLASILAPSADETSIINNSMHPAYGNTRFARNLAHTCCWVGFKSIFDIFLDFGGKNMPRTASIDTYEKLEGFVKKSTNCAGNRPLVLLSSVRKKPLVHPRSFHRIFLTHEKTSYHLLVVFGYKILASLRTSCHCIAIKHNSRMTRDMQISKNGNSLKDAKTHNKITSAYNL